MAHVIYELPIMFLFFRPIKAGPLFRDIIIIDNRHILPSEFGWCALYASWHVHTGTASEPLSRCR